MPSKSGLVVWTMYQSAKPPEVVQDAFFVTFQPSVDPLGAGGHRVPEVAAGLRVGVGERADQAVLVQAREDVPQRLAVVVAQQPRRRPRPGAWCSTWRCWRSRSGRWSRPPWRRRHGSRPCRPAPWARSGRAGPSLASAWKFLRGNRSFLSLSTAFSRSVVRQSSIRSACSFFWLVGQQPLRVPLGAQAPERLAAPHLDVSHSRALPCLGVDIDCSAGALPDPPDGPCALS